MATEADPPRPATLHPGVRLFLWVSKLITLIGIISLMVAACTLLTFGAIETGRYVALLVWPGDTQLTNRQMFLASIKLVDLVLLATVLQVVAFGLYSLFIDRGIPAPMWLRTSDFDGLKSKLAGIVAVMLGVLFLEQVINVPPGLRLLASGIATAAVIFALSHFIQVQPSKD
ncbi:MAG TPA: YqhA family protein [Geminicoccus sp.]|uniref:YqhA family protein n=1 Tax=Geminicoccus sp. TaxID=2024832 RepID=UPI002C3971B8|nr:YqhA family protein [Geminicoccus sp.]HWL68414.1 YqhA family protein [Geminicoccus sp.]